MPDAVTERLADLGNIPVAVPVLAVAMAYAARRGDRRGAVAAGVAMALVPALVVPLKEWTARPGPLEPWAAGYYPSGHTATSAVAYVGAALLLSPYTRRNWPMAVALLLAGATAVGLRDELAARLVAVRGAARGLTAGGGRGARGSGVTGLTGVCL
ncbi:hypothetical protein ACFWA0_08050, partial [Streptomyces xanthophaeus]